MKIYIHRWNIKRGICECLTRIIDRYMWILGTSNADSGNLKCGYANAICGSCERFTRIIGMSYADYGNSWIMRTSNAPYNLCGSCECYIRIMGTSNADHVNVIRASREYHTCIIWTPYVDHGKFIRGS